MSRAARALWGLFLLTVLLAVVFQATGGDTIVKPLRRFFAAVQQTDSWRPMRLAEEYVSASHDRPVYGQMLTSGVKFQYPMSSLLFTRHLNLSWLNGLSWFCVIVVIVAIWRTLRRTGTGTPLEFSYDDPAVGLALIGLALTFYPLIMSYALGQVQAWITALLSLALLAWISGREDLAGVAVGVVCLLKPTYAIVMLWAVVRRRSRFLVPLAGVVLLGTLAALVAYGWSDSVDYLTALRIMSRGGEAFYPNQSVNGLLNRAMGTANSLQFSRYAFAPYHPVVYVGTLLAFVALVGLALWMPARRGAAGTSLDFSILLLTITLTSPIAWIHHYGVLLPILAATAPAILTKRPWGPPTGLLLGVAYIAVSQPVPPLDRAAGVLFGIPQSYPLAGALTILCLLYASLRPTRPLPARGA